MPLFSKSSARLLAVSLTVILLVAACGSSKSKTGSGSGATTPSATTPSSVSANPAIPAGPIKLGLSTPLSGPDAEYGKIIQSTDLVALNYVNSLGGIAGHQLQLVTLDDQNNATTAVQVAEQLVSDHVAGVIGDGIPPLDLQEAPVFDKAHIPTVTFNSVSSGSQYPYIYSENADNSVIATVTEKLIANQKLSPIAFVTDGIPSTQATVSAVIAQLHSQAPQIKILGNDTLPATSLDVTPTLSQLRAAGAKVIYFSFVSQVEGPFFKGLQTLGWSPQLIGTDAMYYLGYNAIGDLGAGSGDYTVCAQDANSSLSAGIISVIQSDIKASPGPEQVLDARENVANILVLKYGIEKANSLSGPAVNAAIQTMTNVSLGADVWKYTYTATAHNGYVSEQVCRMEPLGRFDSPVAVPASVWNGGQ